MLCISEQLTFVYLSLVTTRSFLIFVVVLSVALEITGVPFENIPNKLHNL